MLSTSNIANAKTIKTPAMMKLKTGEALSVPNLLPVSTAKSPSEPYERAIPSP